MDVVDKINKTNSELHNAKSNHHHEQKSVRGQKQSAEMESRGPANNITLIQSSTRNKATKRRSDERRENDFIFGKEIGEGSFSSVYLVKDIHTQQEYAAKKCLKSQIIKEKKIESVLREKQLMNLLNLNENRTAPFFVKLAYAFQTEANFFFILSYCKHGEFLSLIQQVGNFDHHSAQFYTGEIVRALEHLHSLGIVHRDLKPENILLDEKMHIKISDFGSAKKLDTQEEDSPGVIRPSSFVGTAQYVSPEVLHKKQVCLASDLWSLGCIVYQIVSGLPPFRKKSEYLIFKSILMLGYEFPPGFFDDAKDMVQKLLVLDTTQRLGANDRPGRYDSLRLHPFLAPVDLDTLYLATPPTITTFSPDCDDQSIWDESIPPGLETRELDLLMISKPSQTIFQQPAATRPQPPISQLGSSPAQSSKQADATASSQKYQQPLRKISTVAASNSTGSSSSASRGRRNLADLTQDDHNRRLLQQERENTWHKFVDGNLILKQGLLDKKKGLFPRTRMFLLTTGPHLYYVDPVNNVLKGQVPYEPTIRPESKNFKTFFVHTSHRTYYLEDQSNSSLEWIQAIEDVRDYYYPPSSDDRQ